MLSIISSTSRPLSRKNSAMRVATNAALIRTSAGWSEVATTTTERFRPASPRSRSRKSRTSFPRSPTSAITLTSAAVLRAIIPSTVDFPTPDPAKIPTRCPFPTVSSPSIARNTAADVNVIALVGERGKEVRDFLERDLGEAGLKRSVVVVATSDQPALVRIKAAFVATRIAEFFRDKGLDVLLMMDSVTRFAMAQREVGLAIAEELG